jgi:nucleotide-binding universal stress UspA family protein
MSTPNPLHPRCVVVALSADEYGRAALRHAEQVALATGARLVVVNVTRGDSLVDARYAHEDEVAALMARLETEGIAVELHRELVPDVAEAVLRAADRAGADLIVVGVRRRTPVGKLLLGSVAQRVIIEATCPVLAVKPD